MSIHGTVGIGFVGMWGGELCLKGTLPLKGVKAAAVVDTGKGMAAMFMPFKAVHDRKENRTYYAMDELTHAPVASFQYWAADGKGLAARSVERVYFAGDKVRPEDLPVVRFGPNLIRAKSEWQSTSEPSDVLQLFLNAWMPEDEVCFVPPEDRADAMLGWPEHRIQAECPSRIESDGTVYHLKALFAGTVESVGGRGLAIGNGIERKWFPRPAGVECAVSLGSEVKHGQPLFRLATAKAGSPAWRMLADGWRSRMFSSIGKRSYIQARYVSHLPYRCPVCLRDAEEGEKCGDGHELVLAAPLCPDMWIRFSDKRLNYSGEMADLSTFIPDLERCPTILQNNRARRNAVAAREKRRARKHAVASGNK